MAEAILETPHMPGRPEGVVEGHLDAGGQLGLAPARVLHCAHNDVFGLGTRLLFTQYTLLIISNSSLNIGLILGKKIIPRYFSRVLIFVEQLFCDQYNVSTKFDSN